MHPVIDELAKDYAVYTLNVDEHPDVVTKLKANVLPMMIVMDKGVEVTRFIGITAKAEIAKRLKTRKSQTINYELQ
jgi:thioredoxin-like negative regulator of GroEL